MTQCDGQTDAGPCPYPAEYLVEAHLDFGLGSESVHNNKVIVCEGCKDSIVNIGRMLNMNRGRFGYKQDESTVRVLPIHPTSVV